MTSTTTPSRRALHNQWGNVSCVANPVWITASVSGGVTCYGAGPPPA